MENQCFALCWIEMHTYSKPTGISNRKANVAADLLRNSGLSASEFHCTHPSFLLGFPKSRGHSQIIQVEFHGEGIPHFEISPYRSLVYKPIAL